jgi:FixJ family two-component response regulator
VEHTKLQVAVVDDEESVRKALSRLLRSVGFGVEVFPSGQAFLETLRARRPDCVVLDLHMPHTDGFEVQEKRRESGASVPMIMITGRETPEASARSLAAGAVGFLHKPIHDQTLLNAIHHAVEQSKKH